MALPAGVSTFELQFGKTYDFQGQNLRTDLIITPSHEVRTAVGDRVVDAVIETSAPEGQFGSIDLPQPGQSGLYDLKGDLITNFWYEVRGTDSYAGRAVGQSKVWRVQPTMDQLLVDLDVLPTDAVVGPVGSITPPAVLSVNGETGAVTVDGVSDAAMTAVAADPGSTFSAELSATFVAASALTTTPASGSSAGYLSWKGSEVGSVPVVKPLGDGRAGVWEMTHNDTTGYLYHLLAGAAMGHDAALIALGVDNDGIGLLVPNKADGRGIVGDQRATVTDTDAYWLHATQRSPGSALVRLEMNANDAADVLQLQAFGTPGASQKLLYVGTPDGEAGRVYAASGEIRWLRTIEIQNQPTGEVESYFKTKTSSASSSSNTAVAYHGAKEDVFFGATGSAGIYYPYKFAHSSSSFAIQTAPNETPASATNPLPSDVAAWTSQLSISHTGGVAVVQQFRTSAGSTIGLFGATASAQPAAVANATDAATVITQLNALLARLRTIGLIAT